MTQRSD